jgi:hypothetical protein
MRLTLRTLLAYMDGLLDSKDSQEIGKKIEDSKFATDLFHKIRDVMRRLRLAAPAITERATNLDCNTVAEYLDNALPTDRVADFEEVSLKSEMHLAEVASCHQILTMVLGEPAEIDAESRQRMYQLPAIANRVDEERLAAAEAATVLSGDGNLPVAAPPPVKVRPRPVVPEYLRDPPRKSRLLPSAAIMFLFGGAVTLGLLAFRQFDAEKPLGKALIWVQAKLQIKAADDKENDLGDVKKSPEKPGGTAAGVHRADDSKSSGMSPAEPASKSGTSPSAAKGTGESAASAIKNDATASPVGPARDKPVSETPVAAAGSKSVIGATSPSPVQNSAVTPGNAATIPQKKPGIGEQNPATPAAHVGANQPEAKPLADGTSAGPRPASPRVEVARLNPSGVTKPAAPLPGIGPSNSPRPEDKAKVGRFMSDGQDVLLKFDVNTVSWRRVLPEEFIIGHQRLLALPSYRPRVAVLNVGATLELINGTRIELLPDDSREAPGVDIDFGRVVIKPLVQAGARLRVVAGSHTGTVTLTTVESIAGLEVTRVHEPGTDPKKVLSHALTKLYVARGGAVWEEGENKPPVRLTAPAVLMLDGAPSDTSPGAERDPPKWITTNTVNELDQRAALSVSQALPDNRAVGLGLMELTEARQKEIRWLAARCLGYLGQFDPMTGALNDADFRREWPDYIDQLKEAIARGPETASAIRQSLDKQFGNDSDALYRMLWGYTDRDLERGEDARLVKFLDHEGLVFRVLAFANLQEITHQGLYYRPEAAALKRQPSVLQWRRQQQMGRIRIHLPEVKPRAIPPAIGPKEQIPDLKPQNDDVPDEVVPASATEPIESDIPAPPEPRPAKVLPQRRPPVAVPEPEPQQRQPRVAVPEP